MTNDAQRTMSGSEEIVKRLREIAQMFEDGRAATYDNGYNNPNEKEPQVLAGPYDLYDLVTEWQGVDKPGLLEEAADELERLNEELMRAQADPVYDYGYSNGLRASQAEIERLRRRLESLKNRYDLLPGEGQEAMPTDWKYVATDMRDIAAEALRD